MVETKEFLDFLLDIVIGSAKAKADGKLTVGDISHFTPLFSSLIPGVRGVAAIPAELVENPEFEEQGVEYVLSRLKRDLPQGSSEAISEIAADITDLAIRLILTIDDIKSARV